MPAAALRGKTIAVIGAGNMGQALISGLRAHGVPAARLHVVEANGQTAAQIHRRYGVAQATLEEAAAGVDVLVLAVKPHDMAPVLDIVRRAIPGRARKLLVISVAAGLQVEALQRVLGPCPLVRAMPNLPAKVGCGVTVLTAGRSATAAHRKLAQAIFECVGQTAELPERLFDAVTAVSGSGPAYVFVFLKALRDAGARLGLPAEVAQQLALQTVVGSARLVDSVQLPLEALINQVASKHGTTEAALQVLVDARFQWIIESAVSAAARRSRELSATIST
jgi:pyrroline-5-carboxylate reductase